MRTSHNLNQAAEMRAVPRLTSIHWTVAGPSSTVEIPLASFLQKQSLRGIQTIEPRA